MIGLDWVHNAAVDVATRKAQGITARLQRHLEQVDPGRYSAEFPVGSLRERIDLFDRHDRVAYELKVSANNVHFEFYRDVFKVLAHNRMSPDLSIRELVFMAPSRGAARLQRGLGEWVCRLAPELGFKITVEQL